MSNLTAGDIAETLSELRSKIRVFEAFCDQIKANYLPSDGGAAELRLERVDGAFVTQLHMESVLSEFEERIVALQGELEEYEQLPIQMNSGDATEADEDEEPEEAPAPKKPTAKQQGKKNVAATNLRRLDSRQPAPK